MLNNQPPQAIDGGTVNQLLDEAILLFKQHEINLTDDLTLTLELVECLAGFLESKCQVKINDKIDPFEAISEILKQEEIALCSNKCSFH
jgi:hypothetical protein